MGQAVTKLILSSVRKDEFFNMCYLSNSLKQLHALDILEVDPEQCTIDLKPSGGRTAPIDPSDSWQLAFRDTNGAYEVGVTSLERLPDRLRLHLPEELVFHCRRNGIRFATDSRVPVVVQFRFQGESLEGLLMDFSLEGIAVQVPRDNIYSLNESICRGSFCVRSREVGFTSADICNIAYQTDHIRLGLHFRDMNALQAEALADVFHALLHSQSVSFSPTEEG